MHNIPLNYTLNRRHHTSWGKDWECFSVVLVDADDDDDDDDDAGCTACSCFLICATFPAHDGIQLHVSLGSVLGRVRKVCTKSQHRRCRGQLFQILFQETKVNHSSREVFLKTAARTCSRNKRTEMTIYSIFLLQETHLAEACSRWCLNHETCSKGLKPARRIVVLFCSPYSKRSETQLVGHNLDNST